MAPKRGARDMEEAKLVRLVSAEMRVPEGEARALLALAPVREAAETLALAERAHIGACLAEEHADAALGAARNALPYDMAEGDEMRVYREALEMHTSARALVTSARALSAVSRSRLRAACAPPADAS